MKQVNKEILEKWRKLGFLQGLKEGTQMEWRCAKSYELLCNFLEGNKYDDNTIYILFPIIRRILTVNHPRPTRIIQAEELIENYLNSSISDIFLIVPLSKNNYKMAFIKNYLKHISLYDKTIYEILNNKNIIESISEIFEIDFEAELSALFAKYMCHKLCKK